MIAIILTMTHNMVEIGLGLFIVMLLYYFSSYFSSNILIFIAIIMSLPFSVFLFFMGLMAYIFNGIPDGNTDAFTSILAIFFLSYSVMNPVLSLCIIIRKSKRKLSH